MTSKLKKILAEISSGELLDKLSILEIKLDKINDISRREEVNKEYIILKEVKKTHLKEDDKINSLFSEIKKINLILWNIEDQIRIFEKEKNFGHEFVKLARAVYFNNDKRAKIKSEINKYLGSNINEIKQYTDY